MPPARFELILEDAWKGKGVAALTVQTPTSQSTTKEPSRRLSKWKTPEFLAYGCILITVIPYMAYVPYTLSQAEHPLYHLYHRRLSNGWIGSRKVDNSDAQYRSFRNNAPSLLALSLFYLFISNLYNRFISPGRRVLTGKRNDQLYRIPFIVGFAIAMLIGLHGASILKVLAILGVNYWIGKNTATQKFGPLYSWAFNISILFLNELCDGYRFASIHSNLGFLDEMKGFYPRWHVSFNITMLRLVSFNLDYRWALQRSNERSTDVPLTQRQRASANHDLASYNFINYLAYAIYPPLYIAGPIMSFNDFYWQLRRPVRIEVGYIIRYAIRFIFCILTMECILHFMYVVAIKDAKAWKGASPTELAMIGFWNLIIVWLKLLLPWRFFRLWALADGMEPIENMLRCMANNYSVAGFWRGWHRSYNSWLIRYIYIPVGGGNNYVLSTLLVFTFVALWHDLQLRLLAWGWLVSLFIMPEFLLKASITEQKFGHNWWYRHLCAIGGVGNILMLMIANLVGFVIGLEGLQYLYDQVLGTWNGIIFLAIACSCLFVGVQIMFEYREEEMRRGIYRKC